MSIIPESDTTPASSRRRSRRGEGGQALIEFALVLPLLALLMGVAFNGWNGMQLSIRMTSAARAGAIKAANDLGSGNAAEEGNALSDAVNVINQEENTTIYQSSDASAAYYVSMTTSNESVPSDPSNPTGSTTYSVVTIKISGAPVRLVPVIATIGVSVQATARYSS